MGTNRFKGFLSLMKLLGFCGMFSWEVHQQTYSLKAAFILTDRLSCQNLFTHTGKIKMQISAGINTYAAYAALLWLLLKKYARYKFVKSSH